MKKVRLLATLAAAASVLVMAPAAHAASATVRFGLSAGTYAPTGIACEIVVEAGVNGITVLETAKASNCIESYETVTFPGIGTYVTCINRVCSQVLTASHGSYWNMYENGVSTAYGVDGFVADDGDELVFAYKAYCFDAVCPPDLG